MTREADSEIRCTTHCGKRRAVTVGFALGILVIYLVSEWGLRQIVYGQPQIESSTDWKPIVEKLPLLLRDPIERRLTAADLERRIASEKAPAAKMKMLYELAPLYSGPKRKEVLQRIVTEFRHSPQAALAWSTLITEYEIARPVETYLRYAQGVEAKAAEQRVQVWVTGWFALQRVNGADTLPYLLAMSDQGVVSSSLVEAYEQLQNIAIRQKDDALYKKAETLLEPCRELRREEQEGMMP